MRNVSPRRLFVAHFFAFRFIYFCWRFLLCKFDTTELINVIINSNVYSISIQLGFFFFLRLWLMRTNPADNCLQVWKIWEKISEGVWKKKLIKIQFSVFYWSLPQRWVAVIFFLPQNYHSTDVRCIFRRNLRNWIQLGLLIKRLKNGQ